MREWVLPVIILFSIGIAIAYNYEGEVGQSLNVEVGVKNSINEEDLSSNCNLTLYDLDNSVLFSGYEMTNITGTMLRNISIGGGNFSQEGVYIAKVNCTNGVTKGAMAFSIRVFDKSIKNKLDFVLGNLSDIITNQSNIYDHITSINQSVIDQLNSVNMSVYQHVTAVNASTQDELSNHNSSIYDYLSNTIYSYITGFITSILNTMNTSIGNPADYGFNNVSAMINYTQDRQIKRMLTVSGTALNSTGEPVVNGQARSWVFSCGTSTPCEATPIGLSVLTSIINGTYSAQFERELVPGNIYEITTNITGDGESVNVTSYINS